jgi:probable rRNA maturation factor
MHEGNFFLTDKKDEEDWGDIFICIPQIRRQAKEYGVLYKEELYRMTVHGVLHLLGYDHGQKKDEKEMFSLQDKFVRVCVKKY